MYHFRLESAPRLQQRLVAAAPPVPQPLPQPQFPMHLQQLQQVQPMIEGSKGLPAFPLSWMTGFFPQQAPPAVAQPMPGLGTLPLPTAAAGADVPGGSRTAGGGGRNATEAPVAALDDDALSDKIFKSATLGLGQMVQVRFKLCQQLFGLRGAPCSLRRRQHSRLVMCAPSGLHAGAPRGAAAFQPCIRCAE